MPSGLYHIYHIKLWEAIDGSRNIVYTYTDGEIDGITYGDGATSTYSYDACGNITQVSGKENVKYSYDALNRLVREDNAALNKSYTYSYDAGGNITAKKEYAYMTGTLGAAVKTYSYVYGSSWKDKLTSWNGQSITYDGYGNVKSYKGATYTWDRLNANVGATLTFRIDGGEDGAVATLFASVCKRGSALKFTETMKVTLNGTEIQSEAMVPAFSVAEWSEFEPIELAEIQLQPGENILVFEVINPDAGKGFDFDSVMLASEETLDWFEG